MFRSDEVLTPRQKRGVIRRALLRPILTAIVLLVLYFIVPLTEFDGSGLLLLSGVLVVFGIVATWQVLKILNSDRPVLQGVEALAAATPLYLLGYSAVYDVMAATYPGSFSESLSKMGALYFTVTVFATVGFGDITAVTDAARAVVTGQIVLNLVVLGLGGRILYAAIDQSRSRKAQPSAPGDAPHDQAGDPSVSEPGE